MKQAPQPDRLVELRRDLHRHPEPSWCEFWTTARIVEELERIGVDELHLGPDVLDVDARAGGPDEATLAEWRDRALEAGADPDLVETMADGHTGAVAALRRGEGPTVGLRVDIDALPREESEDEAHVPAAEGFRSETGAMHACGHDAHATLGVGVLEAIADSEFQGTFKVFFQPAEERVGGGKPMAESGHLDDVDYLLAVHVGLGYPTGEVVAGVEDILANWGFVAEFSGEPAHAGMRPNEGRNAVQALATAVQNLQAIPRHEDGVTRVNAGVVDGGTAANIVAESATIEGEVRGETTGLKEYMVGAARPVLEHAAAMHDCEVDVETVAEAPGGENDEEVVDVAYRTAGEVPGVDSRRERGSLGGSEDATFLMQRVQERGGKAAYVAVGTDHPGGHHTATFDVDEASLPIGVEWLSRTIRRLAEAEP